MGDRSVHAIVEAISSHIIYDEDERRWVRSQDVIKGARLHVLGSEQAALEHSNDGVALSTSSLTSASVYRRLARTLAESNPEIQPASELLLETGLLRRKLNVSSNNFDTLSVSNLLVHAYIQPLPNWRQDTCQIVAVPRYDSASTLHLIPLFQSKKGWCHYPSVWLEHWLPDDRGAGAWEGDGTVIYQICLSNADARPSLLAVRTARSVHVIRPVMDRTMMGLSSANRKVEVDASVDLETLSLFNGPCADVSFNPWNQFQLATIGMNGLWIVFNLPKDLRTAAKVSSIGNVTTPDQAISHTSCFYKIGWSGDGRLLIVGDGTYLRVLDATKGTTVSCNVALPPQETKTTIIDVQNMSSTRNDFLVLTSVHILIFCLRTESMTALDNGPIVSADFDLQFCCRHYRDTFDLSLQLSISLTDKDVHILLSSRKSSTITNYFLSFEKHAANSGLYVHDTSMLSLGLQYQNSSQTIRIQNLLIRLVKANSQRSKLSRADLRKCPSNVQFISIICLRKDGSLSSSLGCISAENHGLEADVLSFLNDHDWGFRDATAQGSWLEDLFANDYIPSKSDGSDSGVDCAKSDRRLAGPLRKSLVDFTSGTAFVASDAWTVDREALYAIASQELRMHELHDLADWLSNVVDQIDSSEIFDSRQILRITPDKFLLSFNDLENTERALSKVLSRDTPSEYSIATSVRSFMRLLGLAQVGESDHILSSIYRHVISTWIGPLPEHVPASTRLAMERKARHLAAAVCAASMRTILQSPGGVSQTLPTLDSGGPHESMNNKSPLMMETAQNEQQLPASEVAQPLRFEGSIESIARLRRLANLATAEGPIHEGVERVLSHWSLGSDPAEYDYKSHNGSSQVAGSAMTAAEAERMRQKQARQRAREEHRARRIQAKAALEGRQPIAAQKEWQSSQPQRSRGILEPSTSQTGAEMVDRSPQQEQTAIFSQVERGRHGGRPELGLPLRPARRPARKAGF